MALRFKIGRLTGKEQNQDTGTPLLQRMRQSKAVHVFHDNIGYENINVMLLQQ